MHTYIFLENKELLLIPRVRGECKQEMVFGMEVRANWRFRVVRLKSCGINNERHNGPEHTPVVWV